MRKKNILKKNEKGLKKYEKSLKKYENILIRILTEF